MPKKPIVHIRQKADTLRPYSASAFKEWAFQDIPKGYNLDYDVSWQPFFLQQVSYANPTRRYV